MRLYLYRSLVHQDKWWLSILHSKLTPFVHRASTIQTMQSKWPAAAAISSALHICVSYPERCGQRKVTILRNPETLMQPGTRGPECHEPPLPLRRVQPKGSACPIPAEASKTLPHPICCLRAPLCLSTSRSARARVPSLPLRLRSSTRPSPAAAQSGSRGREQIGNPSKGAFES